MTPEVMAAQQAALEEFPRPKEVLHNLGQGKKISMVCSQALAVYGALNVAVTLDIGAFGDSAQQTRVIGYGRNKKDGTFCKC